VKHSDQLSSRDLFGFADGLLDPNPICSAERAATVDVCQLYSTVEAPADHVREALAGKLHLPQQFIHIVGDGMNC